MFVSEVSLLYIVFGWIQFAAGDCPNWWTTHGDSCYNIIPTKATWMKANEICNQSQSHLVEITTQDEHQFVEQFKHRMRASDDLWIGLSDQSAGEWVWTFSLVKASLMFSSWFPGEPDGDGNCAVLLQDDPHWFDRDCQELNYFICEKSLKYSFVVG